MIAFAGLWVIAALVYAGDRINRSWLTPGEKGAAVEALKDVDAVRNFGTTDESAYNAEVRRAQEAVARSQDVAFTFKDHWVSGLLGPDLESAKLERTLRQSRQRASGERPRKLELMTPVVTATSDTQNVLKRALGISE